MKKFTTIDWLYNLYVSGTILATISLVVKLLGHDKETCVALWIVSIALVIPYLIFKQWRQENWTGKDLWPWLILAATGIIYLIINNK